VQSCFKEFKEGILFIEMLSERSKNNFSKISVPLHLSTKCTKQLTFENLCHAKILKKITSVTSFCVANLVIVEGKGLRPCFGGFLPCREKLQESFGSFVRQSEAIQVRGEKEASALLHLRTENNCEADF